MARSRSARRWLEQLLHIHDTPRRTAAAFALGVFVGFSPFLGLHTVLGLVLAFALNLNRVAVVLGICTNLPWIVPAYYTAATLLGAALLRIDVPPGLLGQLRDAVSTTSWGELRRLMTAMTPLLWAYTVGSTIGASILAALAYHLSLRMILAQRGREHGSRQTTDE